MQAKLIRGTREDGTIQWQCPACDRIQQESIDSIYGPSIELICENCGVGHEFEIVTIEEKK
jgi:transcription elongation factor Elf1